MHHDQWDRGSVKDSGRDGTVPQVLHRQGIGMGGTEEDVSRGMGCTAAGRTGGVQAVTYW